MLSSRSSRMDGWMGLDGWMVLDRWMGVDGWMEVVVEEEREIFWVVFWDRMIVSDCMVHNGLGDVGLVLMIVVVF